MMSYPFRLFRNERGASAVEMGLAAPILATFLIGMVDLSRAYSTKLQVEQAAQRSIEMVQRQGFPTGGEATLKAEAENAAGTGSTATVDSWLECNGTRKDYTGSCSSGETYSRHVSVAINKTYTPLFAMRWLGANSDGTYTVHGKAGIRVQ